MEKDSETSHQAQQTPPRNSDASLVVPAENSKATDEASGNGYVVRVYPDSFLQNAY